MKLKDLLAKKKEKAVKKDPIPPVKIPTVIRPNFKTNKLLGTTENNVEADVSIFNKKNSPKKDPNEKGPKTQPASKKEKPKSKLKKSKSTIKPKSSSKKVKESLLPEGLEGGPRRHYIDFTLLESPAKKNGPIHPQDQVKAYAALEHKIRGFLSYYRKNCKGCTDAELNHKIKTWLNDRGIDKDDRSAAHDMIIDMLGDEREMGGIREGHVLPEEPRRTADKLEVGDDVEITGDVNFKEQKGKITSFGKDKRFVVVKLYKGGEHSFHSSDVSEIESLHDDKEDTDEADSFYVAFYDEGEQRSWIGKISKEHGGKWHESTFKGKPDTRWGQSYMSYLKPEDIMQYIHKDYHRGIEIEGPFLDPNEALEHVKQNWGRIDEAKKPIEARVWNLKEAKIKSKKFNGKVDIHCGYADYPSIDNGTEKHAFKIVKNAAREALNASVKRKEFAEFDLTATVTPQTLTKFFETVFDEFNTGRDYEPLDLADTDNWSWSFTIKQILAEGIDSLEESEVKTPEQQLKEIKQLEKMLASMRVKKVAGHAQAEQKRSILAGEKELKRRKAALEKAEKPRDKLAEDIEYTKYADWKQAVLLSYPAQSAKIKFRAKMEGENTTVIASIPGEEKVYGIWDDVIENGQIITELNEAAISTEKQVNKIAKEMLGQEDIEKTLAIPEKTLMSAKEVSHKFVDSTEGPWILRLYKSVKDKFVSVQTPKSMGNHISYFKIHHLASTTQGQP